MNVTWLRLRPLLKLLNRIASALERMNELREIELAYQGLHTRVPKADTSGPDPTVEYVSEEADYLRELEEELGKTGKSDPYNKDEEA